ncbi:MAG: hypothetical protein LBJ11_00090 [Oscillospiraceae bacterium]|jgi:hypothetical protein|nr:hypothetical protein [Oscillospiraceae bacterium]
MRGEIYRILRKKNLYIYFGAFALGYILLVFIRSAGEFSEQNLLADAENLFVFLPAVIGGYLFTALYTDDLHSKNLTALIGCGMGKAKIVLSKLLLMALFGALLFGLVPLLMDAVYAMFGAPASAAVLKAVYIWALKSLLTMFAYAALSGIVVYGVQRATVAVVLYLLLALGIVSQLLGLLFSWDFVASIAPNLADHLMSGISVRIVFSLLGSGSGTSAWIEYAIYVAASAVLSVVAFHKKELEF